MQVIWQTARNSPQQPLDYETVYLLIHIKKLNEITVNYFKVLLKTHFNKKPLVTNSLSCVLIFFSFPLF